MYSLSSDTSSSVRLSPLSSFAFRLSMASVSLSDPLLPLIYWDFIIIDSWSLNVTIRNTFSIAFWITPSFISIFLKYLLTTLVLTILNFWFIQFVITFLYYKPDSRRWPRFWPQCHSIPPLHNNCNSNQIEFLLGKHRLAPWLFLLDVILNFKSKLANKLSPLSFLVLMRGFCRSHLRTFHLTLSFPLHSKGLPMIFPGNW